MEEINTNHTTEDMSINIGEIAAALSAAQSELESAKKDSSGYGYNYSDLSSVIATAKPVLSKHGLSITQLVGAANAGMVKVTTILAHSSNQFFKSTATIPIVEMKGCNEAQRVGSSISYLRRYAYQSILGMSSEDNDASSEGFKKSAAPKKAAAAPKRTSSLRRKPAENDDDI